MAESFNIEASAALSEREEPRPGKHWSERAIEIVEVIVQAIVAVATAWSGYQAARWDGRQGLRYGESSRVRFQADAASTHGARA
jgi:hypothetical protein